MGVRCTVVIPTWQRARALRETLDSLARQTCADFEVVVVGDGDDPPTRAFSEKFIAAFPLRWIFHQQNLGLAAARNTGANAAAGDILLFLDDDTPAHQDLVSQHLRHFDETACDGRGYVYGRIVEDRRAALPLWTDKFLQHSWERTLQQACSRPSTGDGSVGDDVERRACFGLNCSIRRDVFLDSGGFNPALRYTDEEMEYGHRLYRSGVRFVVDPLAIVYHHNEKSMTEYFRRCWGLSGQVDVKRVFELGQRNPQTRQLASMHHGHIFNQLVARTFWHCAPAMRGLTSLLERTVNSTGLLFGPWARVCRQTEYWSGVRTAGCTARMLRQAAGEAGCALMLHSISAPQSPEERAYLSPQRFHRYMRWLKTFGYESASAAEWLRGDFSRKRILLTFDDGYDDLYTELLPATIEYGLKPLVFLVADRTGETNVWDHERGLRRRSLLTLQQIREMQRHGVEFGSHTLTHPWLPDLSDDALRREVGDSKRRLEDLLGTEVTTFAYPFGGVDQRVRAAVADAGYGLAFTVAPGLNWWSDPLCLPRADINENCGLPDFAMQLRTGFTVRGWLGLRVHALETGLPTEFLRSTVRAVHAGARRTRAVFKPR